MSSFQSYSATSLSASQTVENFNAVRAGNILPKAGANLAETNGAHDIGSSTYKWGKGYFAGISSSVTVSAPVTFTASPTFNTTTSATRLYIMPQMMVVKYAGGDTRGYFGETAPSFIVPFNTVSTNTIQNATLTTNQVSLPAGSYVYSAFVRGIPFALDITTTAEASVILFDATASVTLDVLGPLVNMVYYAPSVLRTGVFSLLTTSSIEARIYVNQTGAFWIGDSSGYNDGSANVFQQIVFFKVS